MRPVLLCLALLLPATSPAQDRSVLDLAGRPEQQVRPLLGEPLSCRPTYQGTSCSYENGNTEIIYIDARADWITFTGMENVPFTAEALRHVGLAPAPPLARNPTRLLWLQHQGMEAITVYGDGHAARMIQVRAYTPN